MKINIKKVKFNIKLAVDKERPDLLAYTSLIFAEENKRYFAISGFTIRKSKFNGKPYLAPPSRRTKNGFFVYTLFEKTLWREIEKEVIKQYEYETIPIIEEDGEKEKI